MPRCGQLFAEARAIADGSKSTLRLRHRVGPSAPELHGLYWEALSNPDDGSPVLTGEWILLSRYLISADWRPVSRRQLSQMMSQ
jgi:hypothetical protein